MQTGHCHLKGNLFKLGVVNSPSGTRCHDKDETASLILCDHRVLAELRSYHLVLHFMQQSDLWSTEPHSKCRATKLRGL
jgi:hypothetical protein